MIAPGVAGVPGLTVNKAALLITGLPQLPLTIHRYWYELLAEITLLTVRSAVVQFAYIGFVPAVVISLKEVPPSVETCQWQVNAIPDAAIENFVLPPGQTVLFDGCELIAGAAAGITNKVLNKLTPQSLIALTYI